MKKFTDWLAIEPKTWWAIIGYAAFAALISISLDYTVHNALLNWGILQRPKFDPAETPMHPFYYMNAAAFIGMFLWAPLKEETFHRIVPLGFITKFISKKPWLVFGVMTLFAIVFGAIHPYGAEGKILTGISGFWIGLVFLKCGGMTESYFKASTAAILAHSIMNILVVLDAWWQFFEIYGYGK